MHAPPFYRGGGTRDSGDASRAHFGARYARRFAGPERPLCADVGAATVGGVSFGHVLGVFIRFRALAGVFIAWSAI